MDEGNASSRRTGAGYGFIATDPKDGETNVWDYSSYRPLRGGIKISTSRASLGKGYPIDQLFASTMGLIAITTDDNPGRHVLLTNYHCIQEVVPRGPVGQPHADPGSGCSNCGSELIGNVYRWAEHQDFPNSTRVLFADAAICALNAGLKWHAGIAKAAVGEDMSDPIVDVRDVRVTPGQPTPPELVDLPVKKRGMKTGLATGTIGDFNAGHNITVDGKTFWGVDIQPDNLSFSAPIFQITPDAPPFATRGDSGSIICDMQNRVVGLLFSTKPDGTSSLAFHIKPVLDALKLMIPTSTTHPGEQTVPANNNPYAAITLSNDQHLMEKLQEDLLQTAHGTAFVRKLFRHVPEIRGLINSNPRAAAAWRSAGGPAVIQNLLRGVENPELPLLRLDRESAIAATERLAGVLRRYGSEKLRADVDALAAAVERLIGLNYRGLLEKLNTAPVI